MPRWRLLKVWPPPQHAINRCSSLEHSSHAHCRHVNKAALPQPSAPCSCACSTMLDLIKPKLVYLDMPLFMALLSDLFPGLEVPPPDGGPLVAAVEAELGEAGLQVGMVLFSGGGRAGRTFVPHRPQLAARAYACSLCPWWPLGLERRGVLERRCLSPSPCRLVCAPHPPTPDCARIGVQSRPNL
jgi:hypothetical protein